MGFAFAFDCVGESYEEVGEGLSSPPVILGFKTRGTLKVEGRFK
jgi:hypothetical protein